MPPPPPARSRLSRWGAWASVAWFLVPALVLFLVFVLAPIVVAVWTGFFKWGGIGPMDDFVGFANYTKLFDDQVFLGDLWRGLYLIVLSITVQLPFALFTAVLLNQRLRGRAVYRMLFFAPYILSEVVTAVLFTMIFLPGAGDGRPPRRPPGPGGLAGQVARRSLDRHADPVRRHDLEVLRFPHDAVPRRTAEHPVRDPRGRLHRRQPAPGSASGTSRCRCSDRRSGSASSCRSSGPSSSSTSSGS